VTTSERPHPRTEWLAHHFTPLMCLALGPSFIDAVFPGIDVVTVVFTLTFPLTWVLLFANQRHEAMLCVRCAAEFPADGDQQATDKLGSLRYHHRYQRRAAFVAFLAWIGSLWAPWLWLVVGGWLLLDQRHNSTHRRLALWCPWCRRGHDDLTPAPTPVPTGKGDR